MITQAANRQIFTPEDYTAAFNEGREAYRKDSKNAVSPYLKLDHYPTLFAQTQSAAWENGWWSAAKEAANGPR